MNKKLKKANEVLAAAREYAASVSKDVSEQGAAVRQQQMLLAERAAKKAAAKEVKKQKAIDKATEELKLGKTEYKQYRKCVVVKIAKGDFRVEADGMVIERRFKSVTAANEWVNKHTV